MLVNQQTNHAYEFGPFQLVPEERLLLCNGGAVALSPKDMDLLLVLVESRGRLLQKDELMKHLWPESFVEEANLSHHVFILRKVLNDHAHGVIYIETVPKHGYRFAVPVREVREDEEPATIPRRQHVDELKPELEELKEESNSGTLAGAPPAVRPARRTWVWAAVAMVVVAMAVAGWLFRGTARKPAAAPEVVPLTSYIGSEEFPSFSPDGNQVAFSWNGEQDNFDIYVKLIGSPTPVRLTTDPADDVSPAFSPDGRYIGFVRLSKERATFIVIPAIGGRERVVAGVARKVSLSGHPFSGTRSPGFPTARGW